MRDECILTLRYDEDAGQVVLEGPHEGPAGGASVSPAEGVELIFDGVDGRLSRVYFDADQSGRPGAIAPPAMAVAAALFGSAACAVIQNAACRTGTPIAVTATPETQAALSRLARLDAARVISPALDSPLWSVEAAQLATRAGLAARAVAETHRAVAALRDADDLSSSALSAAAVMVADLVEVIAPELAKRLRARVTVDPSASHSARARAVPVPDLATHGSQRGSVPQHLQCWLDPLLVPTATFQHALWPDAELTVRAETPGLVVMAELAPGAQHQAVAPCRARLVDPDSRAVLRAVPFRRLTESLVRAELAVLVPPHETWLEVVSDETRPVLSGQLHHIRRAMRWADAALSARRQSFGLADAEWIHLEALAWGRCTDDWSAAGDADRAYLAAVRQAAIYPGIAIPPEPSGWAKELASRAPLVEEPFLAESVI
jgi:hypothetical protein